MYKMALIEFLLFALTSTLGRVFLCDPNELITIFVASECFGLYSNLLSKYTKKDVQPSETTKYPNNSLKLTYEIETSGHHVLKFMFNIIHPINK